MRGEILGIIMVLAAATGCRGDDDAKPKETTESAPAEVTARAPKASSAPEREATPAPQPTPVAGAEAKPELRFDMTQDGEPQTAEKFEEWLDEKGVKVAEGAEAQAASAATSATAGVSSSAGTQTKAGSDTN